MKIRYIAFNAFNVIGEPGVLATGQRLRNVQGFGPRFIQDLQLKRIALQGQYPVAREDWYPAHQANLDRLVAYWYDGTPFTGFTRALQQKGGAKWI